MNLLFIGDNSQQLNRIRNICDQSDLKFYSVENGYDALNLIQLTPIRIIILSQNQLLMKTSDLIKKLRQQKKPYLLYTLIEKKTFAGLNELLAVGNDRWLLNESPDSELLDIIRINASNKDDFLKIDRNRFELNRKFGINNLIGSSPAMTGIYRDLEKTIGTEMTILIQGESGSGKELIARILHLASPRSGNRFVGINCAAIPKELLESELFGYEKGAFTGAGAAKAGKFQVADKGTLFLDEIADMDVILQSKILRMIEQREFERIGSNETLRADVRIISASNKPLEDEIEAKRFRMDLFYRINSFTISLPPLRERQDDLLPLMAYIIQQLNVRNRWKIEWFEDGVLDIFKQHNWSGNIRELENVLSRTALFTDGSIIKAETLDRTMPASDQNSQPTQAVKPDESAVEDIIPITELEKNAIINALKATGGNITLASKKLGLSRVTIWRKIDKYDLKNQIKEINENANIQL